MDAGGREQEMQVNLDVNKLASYNLTISQVINILQAENVDISAGTQNMGRRSYRIRTVHKFTTPEDIKNIILVSNQEQRVTIGDIATVDFGYETASSVAMFLGKDGIFLGVQPSSDANIVQLTNDVEKVVNQLNETTLKKEGLNIKWIYVWKSDLNFAM